MCICRRACNRIGSDSVWFEHSECSETHSSGGRPTGSASRLSRAHESRVESEPRVPKARAAHPRRYRGFDPEREAVLQVPSGAPCRSLRSCTGCCRIAAPPNPLRPQLCASPSSWRSCARLAGRSCDEELLRVLRAEGRADCLFQKGDRQVGLSDRSFWCNVLLRVVCGTPCCSNTRPRGPSVHRA